ncbi:MAG: HAD family hydrolase [Candidatus Omnitrophota bacterium]|nr:HAD family hydrolase [Candidatus Omnitrophota bacterium]
MGLNIKLIIFDLDGTLIDAYKAIAVSFNFTMQKLNLPQQSFHTIKKSVGWGDEGLLKPFVEKENLKKALLIYRRHHKESLKTKSRLFPFAKKVLEYLKKKKYILSVASNRPRKFSDIVLKSLKIKKYFNYILCADQIKRLKPHPDIIYKIMKRFSVKKEATLYVGDMTVDVEAGKRAMVMTIAVLTGSSSKKDLIKAGPDLIFKDISGLLKIL